MKKASALIVALAFFVGPASWNQPARAQVTDIEYGLIAALIAVAAVTILKSDLPPSQKRRLIHTIKSWNKLPPTKKNVAYVRRNLARIKRLLATANDPKSRLALQRYMTDKKSPQRKNKTTEYRRYNLHHTQMNGKPKRVDNSVMKGPDTLTAPGARKTKTSGTFTINTSRTDPYKNFNFRVH